MSISWSLASTHHCVTASLMTALSLHLASTMHSMVQTGKYMFAWFSDCIFYHRKKMSQKLKRSLTLVHTCFLIQECCSNDTSTLSRLVLIVVGYSVHDSCILYVMLILYGIAPSSLLSLNLIDYLVTSMSLHIYLDSVLVPSSIDGAVK